MIKQDGKKEPNQMATEQAYYALTAYERFTGGKTRLYDMTDVDHRSQIKTRQQPYRN